MQFFNRIQEAKDIVLMVNENNHQNKVIVLYGISGIGKSSLVRKLMQVDLSHYISIRVEVSKSSPDTIENLYYLNKIYKTFCELSQNKMSDGIPTPPQQGLKNWRRIVQFAFGFAKSKAGIEAENRLFEPIEENSVIRKKDYIIHLLKQKAFIVTIENAQNMDTQSFEIIFEILRKVSSTTFVFEYTCESGGNDNLRNFINELESANAVSHYYEIKKLKFEEAKKLVPHYHTIDYDDQVLKKKYEDVQGNLIQMKLISADMDLKEDPIKQSLKMLSKEEKYLVNILYLNEGKISTILLFELLVQRSYKSILFTQLSLKCLIEALQDRQIIYQNGDFIGINHDSIITELESQQTNPSLYLAYNLLTSYYYDRKIENPNDESSIEKLFGLYLKFSDEAILELVGDLKKILLRYKYPQTVITKLSHLRDKLMSKPNANLKMVYELSLMMLEVSYSMELVKLAEENLHTIFVPGNSLHVAYQAGLLAMKRTNQDYLTEINKLINQAQTGSRPRLVMELILLAEMMQVSPLSQSKVYAEKMMEVDQYKQYLEYGFLLRNYAELVDIVESIRIYNECLDFFDGYGREDLKAQILISLSMCHAYKGNLEISKNNLNTAIEITSRPLKENMLLNNYAVLDMLSGQFSEQVVKNLNDSLLLTSNQYESIIIKCNLLIYYVNKQQTNVAKQLSEEIEKCDYHQYQYEELLHIVFQNLMFYYKSCNDIENQNKYKNKIRELLSQHNLSDEMKHYGKLMLDGEKSSDYFYTQFPFRADFLGYWEFEISRELEHFELTI